MGDKVLLKNGETTEDIRLDRIYELDWRSLNYTVDEVLTTDGSCFAVNANLKKEPAPPRSQEWDLKQWFDQGREGACVGFAFTHDLAASPVEVQGLTDQYARSIYLDAQKIDPWPGGAYPGASPFYEGTSILAGAKICQERGFFESYHWALTIEELARGIGHFGPCILGVKWYTGMYNTDNQGFIHPTGSISGGHAILALGVKIVYKKGVKPKPKWGGGLSWEDVDLDASYLILHNSWGRDWGKQGRAKLSLTAMSKLLADNGDACFPKRTNLLSV